MLKCDMITTLVNNCEFAFEVMGGEGIDFEL